MASTFNANDPRYRCCCGSYDAKQGGYILSVVELIWGAFTLAFGIYNTTETSYAIGGVLGSCAMIAAGCLGIAGTKHNNKMLLIIDYIIHIIMVVLATLAVGLSALGLVLALSVTDIAEFRQAGYASKSAYETNVAVLLGVTVIVLALDIWFMRIIKAAYDYVRDQSMAGVYLGGGAPYSGPTTMVAIPQQPHQQYPPAYTATAGQANVAPHPPQPQQHNVPPYPATTPATTGDTSKSAYATGGQSNQGAMATATSGNSNQSPYAAAAQQQGSTYAPPYPVPTGGQASAGQMSPGQQQATAPPYPANPL